MALNNAFTPHHPELVSKFNSSLLDSGFASLNPVSSARFPLSSAGVANAPISVPNTDPAVMIHKCDITAIDEVYLWCGNYGSSDTTLTLGIGGMSNEQTISIEIPKNAGLVQIYPGVPHSNVILYAKASAASSLNIIGFVTRKYLNVSGDSEFGYSSSE